MAVTVVFLPAEGCGVTLILVCFWREKQKTWMCPRKGQGLGLYFLPQKLSLHVQLM